MAVGSLSPDNVKAELFDLGTGQWEDVADYPFSSLGSISSYDMTFIPEMSAYIVIGGNAGYQDSSSHPLTTIAKFHDDVWSKVGQLNTARTVRLCFMFLSKLF